MIIYVHIHLPLHSMDLFILNCGEGTERIVSSLVMQGGVAWESNYVMSTIANKMYQRDY